MASIYTSYPRLLHVCLLEGNLALANEAKELSAELEKALAALDAEEAKFKEIIKSNQALLDVCAYTWSSCFITVRATRARL